MNAHQRRIDIRRRNRKTAVLLRAVAALGSGFGPELLKAARELKGVRKC